MVHDVPKLLKVLAKLGSVEELHIVYEAGPTGFGLQRALTARGYFCEVIAPSKTPRQSGNRVKTDARDGLELAEYSRVQKRGVQANKVCVAVARELAGFVWAIGMQARRERGASA